MTHLKDARTDQPRLSGRQQELAILWSQFEESTTGCLRVVLVAGEPGIGKTRLLGEVAGRAEQRRALVLRGGASEAEGMPPYLPFLTALGSYIRAAPPDQLRAHVGPLASILATILPELAVSLGNLPSSYPLPAEQARLRLFEAVGLFLAAIATTAPLVLLLDDLQWADRASLDLLSHLAGQQSTVRLLILGAYREGELRRNVALERSILQLNRLRLLTPLTLAPLLETEVASLATTVLGVPLDPDVRCLLYTHSEGNPFFAEELLHAWRETGMLVLTPNSCTPRGSLRDALPSSITGVVRSRLARLSGEVVDILRTAATIGRTFDLAFLAEVMGQEEEAVEDHLLEAVHAGLLRVIPSDAFSFSHDNIRECLFTEMTPVRRRRLHGFIGRVLETRTDQEHAEQLARLAFHFASSGDRARGASYAQRAAERALRTYAFEDAATHTRTALELLDAQDEQRGTLLLGLGESAVLAGAEHEAVAVFQGAQQWFSQRHDQRAAARAAYGVGRAWGRLEVHSAAHTAFETALALLKDHPGSEMVQVLVDLATLLAVSLGHQAEGIAYGQQALDLTRRLADEHLEAMANRTLGNLLMRGNDLPAAIPLLEHALTLAETADDSAEAAECCACLTLAYLWSGHVKRAQQITHRQMAFATRCHEPYQLRHIALWLAMLALVQGQFAEAEQLLNQAQSAVASLASPEPVAFLQMFRGALSYYQGDYLVAEQQFRSALVVFREMGPSVLLWQLAPLGIVQLLQGKQQEAVTCMDEVETLLASQQEGMLLMADALSKVALMAVMLGDEQRVARFYPKLVAFQGLYIDFLIDRILGEMNTVLGAWSQAKERLIAAEATARREGILPELARTLVAQATLELAQGGRGSAPRARNLFEQADAVFERLGMRGEAQMLQERLLKLPRKSSVRQARALPAGLSEREVEVLRLIAAGKSNRQIADELILSEKTVANHLLHIFNKTGTENRTSAAAFAIHHGLA